MPKSLSPADRKVQKELQDRRREMTDVDREAMRIALAQQTLPGFASYCLRDNNGDRIIPAPHQIAWSDHLWYTANIQKVCGILAAMAHGKTQWMAIALPLYLLGVNPNFRIMIVSSSEGIARKRLQTIGRYIKQSRDYKRVFPNVIPDEEAPWNSHELYVKRVGSKGDFVGSVDPSVAAYGYTTEGIGSRCDILIFDDVATYKNSVIESASREQLKALCDTQWISRPDKLEKRGGLIASSGRQISKDAIIIYIGTRYHEEDIYQTNLINQPSAACTMIQSIAKDKQRIHTRIIGAAVKPVHPILYKHEGCDCDERMAA